MDLTKVVEWVVHNKLENVVQNNEPTGQAKTRKVCLCVCVCERVSANVSVSIYDYS